MIKSIGLCVLVSLAIAPAALAQKITKQTFTSDGSERTYYLFVPDSARNKPAPLVVLLHGSGRDGRILVEHWQSLAKKEGIVLAGPDATIARRLEHARRWAVAVAPLD